MWKGMKLVMPAKTKDTDFREIMFVDRLLNNDKDIANFFYFTFSTSTV